MSCKAITRCTSPAEEDGETGVGKCMNWRNEQCIGVSGQVAFLLSWALMSPEKKQGRKWGWGRGGETGRAVWTTSGWEGATLQGRGSGLSPFPGAAEPQPPILRAPEHLETPHSAVGHSMGTEEMQQWGTNASQHPALTVSTQHPWEQQSLASYLTKSAKIIIFERKKSD